MTARTTPLAVSQRRPLLTLRPLCLAAPPPPLVVRALSIQELALPCVRNLVHALRIRRHAADWVSLLAVEWRALHAHTRDLQIRARLARVPPPPHKGAIGHQPIGEPLG